MVYGKRELSQHSSHRTILINGLPNLFSFIFRNITIKCNIIFLILAFLGTFAFPSLAPNGRSAIREKVLVGDVYGVRTLKY